MNLDKSGVHCPLQCRCRVEQSDSIYYWQHLTASWLLFFLVNCARGVEFLQRTRGCRNVWSANIPSEEYWRLISWQVAPHTAPPPVPPLSCSLESWLGRYDELVQEPRTIGTRQSTWSNNTTLRPVRTVRGPGLRTRLSLHRSRELSHSIYRRLLKTNRKKRQGELPSGRNVCLKCLKNEIKIFLQWCHNQQDWLR